MLQSQCALQAGRVLADVFVCLCVCWQDDCEAELCVAMPLLESALAALNTLSKADITEMRAMKNPPQPVKRTMEAVCQLLGVKSKKVSAGRQPRQGLCCNRLQHACNRLQAQTLNIAPCAAMDTAPTQKGAVSEGTVCYVCHVLCAVQINDPNDPTRKLDDYWTPSQVRVCVLFRPPYAPWFSSNCVSQWPGGPSTRLRLLLAPC